MNKIIYILPFIALFSLIGLHFYSRVEKDTINFISEEAPDFELTDMASGEKVTPTIIFNEISQEHDLVMVNFFASWCSVCLVERKQLIALSEKFNIPIIGIAFKDRKKEIQKTLDTMGNPYERIILDTKGYAAATWKISGTPESFIIDKSGKIHYRHKGPIRRLDLKQRIKKVLSTLREEAATE